MELAKMPTKFSSNYIKKVVRNISSLRSLPARRISSLRRSNSRRSPDENRSIRRIISSSRDSAYLSMILNFEEAYLSVSRAYMKKSLTPRRKHGSKRARRRVYIADYHPQCVECKSSLMVGTTTAGTVSKMVWLAN